MTWWLVVLFVCIVAFPLLFRVFQVLDTTSIVYIVQPILSLIGAFFTWRILGGKRDRTRHATERALIVGSVMAMWFVAYFMSGMIVTFTHNAVVASVQSVLVNIAAFGISAAAIEYMRHGVMLSAGRRNVVWFGVVVSLMFACEQIGLSQFLNLQTVEDSIKFGVATVAPAIASSFLLTYLAFNAGYWPQLTFRLGLVATLYLPPIIPKYDWYLTGISLLLLSIAVYIAIDRTRKDLAINGRHYRHARRAYDVMFAIVMVVLVLFMTGAFTYKPEIILSNSMVPVYSRGAMVIVQKADVMDVEVGDIVQYRTAKHSVTHRVTAIDLTTDGSGERVFTTQGDNSPSPDEPVKADQIVGIIRAQIPFIGYPTVWLSEFAR